MENDNSLVMNLMLRITMSQSQQTQPSHVAYFDEVTKGLPSGLQISNTRGPLTT